ncbi:AAA family ATPase [Piscinibacter sp. XHJ-5]|uniref:AAA family ATPase n=1 Tax=Piscinibacter sp. XHJ-5 TaxID=3037797 RepID=UPI00245282DA|nr:AAA family ATPase [Piscinibacter sp. XHJ-5]
MDSASQPRSSFKGKLIKGGAVLAAALLLAGATFLQQQAQTQARSRKDPTALAFEKTPQAWLADPREASEFERALAARQVTAVAVDGLLVLYTDSHGARHSTRMIDCGPGCRNDLASRLTELSVKNGFALTSVEIDARSGSEKAAQAVDHGATLLGSLLPLALIVGLLVWVQSKGGLSLGRAHPAERPSTRFDDVIGADEAKRALRRVAAFMKDPAQYAAVGAKPPRGVLLDGPPGTGKTLLARALAGECGARFIAVDGSYFSSMFYGAGIGKVRELFQRARASAPCIVFIDEIDGLGKRSQGGEARGGEQEQNRIINRLLVEMDGFSPLDNVVVVGATNHVDNIDEAMRRPGRFDMTVSTALPTPREREALFGMYLRQVKAAAGIELGPIARTATGLSPADIANCVNRAAACAAEAGEALVSAERLAQALETHQLGGEVSSAKDLITPDTLRRIAFHESGHALVAHVLNAGTVERVSIEPRGRALGVTYVARHSEEPLHGERELLSRLAMMLAGREAELIAFGNASSGAADDLMRASELATSMIGRYGFGKTFGLLSMAGVPKELIGPDIQKSLLDEARQLLESAQAECRKVLDEHHARLTVLAELLLGHETVSGALLKKALSGGVPHGLTPANNATVARSPLTTTA